MTQLTIDEGRRNTQVEAFAEYLLKHNAQEWKAFKAGCDWQRKLDLEICEDHMDKNVDPESESVSERSLGAIDCSNSIRHYDYRL